MKHRVSDLEGNHLDAAVAMALDQAISTLDCMPVFYQVPRYSTEWRLAGPIIQREHIKLAPFSETYWEAVVYDFKREPDRWPGRGPTPLIAAMRAYVASKLGEEVELP